MTKERAKGYAVQYVNNTRNRDISKMTDEHLGDVLRFCASPPRDMQSIRQAIKEMIDDAAGQPIGCKRE